MRRAWPLAIATLVGACQCHGPGVDPNDPADFSAAPSPLVLPNAWVGQAVEGVVTVTDKSLGAGSLAVSVTPPFTALPASLDVAGGGTGSVTVHFTAAQPGQVSGTLTLGPLTIPVQATALAIPDCAPTACTTARFDLTLGQCVSAPLADGTSCQSACVTGTCAIGVCLGTLVSCDDGDACTVDACNDNAGCIHVPRVCPQDPSQCQSATCDPAVGCGIEPAVDGTLCGPDDCLATQVNVCIAATCVQRPRPATGRCSNTWVPVFLAQRAEPQVAYDVARQRTVLFGGIDVLSKAPLGDTWEYDGATWTFRTPATSPPPRYWHAMAYDPLRQRIVLFGGHGSGFNQLFDDTWEYDGVTWVQRMPAASPSARYAHSVAFDSARAKLVLFGGGNDTTEYDDTWEWNGATWTLRAPTHAPAMTGSTAMAYDAVRRQTVLVSTDLHDVWEWDGTDWTKHTPPSDPGGRFGPGFVWDLVRQRVVLVGGLGGGHPEFDAWTWDGNVWAQLSVANPPPGVDEVAAAYDAVRQRIVAVAADSTNTERTWELDAQGWHDRTTPNPAALVSPSLVYDEARDRVVLFGGADGQGGFYNDTWEWDGGAWSKSSPETAPPGRAGAAFAWSGSTQRCVLFGGNEAISSFSDTWTWDGSSWASTTATGPSARDAWATYDAARGVVLLFGGEDNAPVGDTWAFDGAHWHELSPPSSPSARGAPLAYDSARGEVILFGGRTDGGVVDETWAWDGGTWAQRLPPTAPSPRHYHALAYDRDRQRTVLFGGEDALGNLVNDTWEWDGASWSQRMPVTSPPPGYVNAMAYDAAHQRMVIAGSSGTWLLLP